jgi:putative SOS response-associated peptidase YedK
MLTINADNHEFMRQFHKPADEKRMVVILEEHQYTDWLAAPSNSSMGFMAPYLTEQLTAIAPQEKVGGVVSMKPYLSFRFECPLWRKSSGYLREI